METDTPPHTCQVAFTALDAAALRRWYIDVFDLESAGRIAFFPPSTTRVQGIPGAWERLYWAVDAQDYFQLEFFQFWRPRSRPRPEGWRPCDIGYNMLGIVARDFDRVMAAAASSGAAPTVAGPQGDRRACLTDPEGNLVEVRERDPLAGADASPPPVARPEIAVSVRFMRVSVPRLALARQAYVEALGLRPMPEFQLHSAGDEALWGLPGAVAERLVLRADNFLLELVEYQSPAPRPRPPGYQLSDQGFMNIALGYRDRVGYDRALAHATASGMKANGKVVDIGVFRVMYVNDTQGFSVELLFARRPLWRLSGFLPTGARAVNEIAIEAPAAAVWRKLTDHAGLGEWTPFSGTLLTEGRPTPGGIGCRRQLSAPGISIVEEITAWEEGRHYGYKVVAGAPFRHHQGDVIVIPQGDNSTRVRWTIRLESRIPLTSRLLAGVLQLVFRHALRRLKNQLEAPC